MVLRKSVRHIDERKEAQTMSNQGYAFPFAHAPGFPGFPAAVDNSPMPKRHDQMMPTMDMYSPT